jgi:uncharacterized membrane protein (UPF0182 family)
MFNRLIINLALLMLVILFIGRLVDVVIGLLWHVVSRFNSSWVGELFFFVVTVLLIVGLGVRAVRTLTSHGVRSGREQAAQVRQSRQAVRRPAPDVPVMAERAIPIDRDPALDDGED